MARSSAHRTVNIKHNLEVEKNQQWAYLGIFIFHWFASGQKHFMASSPGKSTRSKHSLSNHKYMSDSVWWYRTMCWSLLTLHGLATLESASVAYDSWLLISCFLLFCFLTRSCPRRGSGGDRGPSIWGKKEIILRLYSVCHILRLYSVCHYQNDSALTD